MMKNKQYGSEKKKRIMQETVIKSSENYYDHQRNNLLKQTFWPFKHGNEIKIML